jgi:Asp-tRNA(Asn)/Glu-tRNA(Gln) amidotransferase B subunit
MFEEADEPSSDIEEWAALALLPEKSKEKYKRRTKTLRIGVQKRELNMLMKRYLLLAYFEQKSRTCKGSTQ